MKPTLLVDAHSPGESGVGRYTRELVRALARRDDFASLVLAGDPAVLAPWAVQDGAAVPVRVVPFAHARHSPLVPLGWSRIEALAPGPRVSWFPLWDGAWSAAPAVTTIHDLIHLDGRGLGGALKAAVTRAWIGRMVQGSTALVTVSAHAAARIEEEFPATRGKLHVIHNGVSEVFFRVSRTREAPYLLTVGNKRAHKRFETAIRAFALLAAERPELTLRMVGNRDAHTAALRALAQSLGVADRVHDVNALDDEALAQTYANAEALLVSSQVEGFGLIAVEAMAAGTPVIAVDRAPFPEVMGDAGVLVPYDDPAAMAAAVRGLDRAALATRGRARAATFTWARAAEALASVLARAAH